MITEIRNDPFKVVFKAFNEMYPDKVAFVQFDQSLDMSKNEFGYCDFNGGGVTNAIIIGINPKVTIEDSIELLCHELAHLAVGFEANHNEVWDNAFTKLVDRTQELFIEDHSPRSDS